MLAAAKRRVVLRRCPRLNASRTRIGKVRLASRYPIPSRYTVEKLARSSPHRCIVGLFRRCVSAEQFVARRRMPQGLVGCLSARRSTSA